MIGEQLSLSLIERGRLESCERIIAQGFETFVQVGNALLEIRDGRLYRAEFNSFEDYCRQRWQITKPHAHRLIRAAETVSNLVPIGTMPTHESQVRPLAKLAPVQQREAWQIATQINPQPTAAEVEQVAQTIQRAVADANEAANLERLARTRVPERPNPAPINPDWIEFKGSLRRLLKIDPFDAEAVARQELQIHCEYPNLTQEVIDQCNEALVRIQKFLVYVQC